MVSGRPVVDVRRVETDDGVNLHVEVSGSGSDVFFLHEFSGNHASWDHQVLTLSRRYRCITYSARGFLPSDVPTDVSMYSQDRAIRDALQILAAVSAGPAHVVGLSMGAFVALHLALEFPDVVRSAAVGSCGYGAEVDAEDFQREMAELADLMRDKGMEHLAALSARSPYRLVFEQTNPEAFARWVDELGAHDSIGAAATVLGVQARRPTLSELVTRLPSLSVPVLFMVGDEDEPCIEGNIAAKRASPLAGLAVLPKTGHTLNLEDPGRFNAGLIDFFERVDQGRWPTRDPRSMPASAGWVR